MTNRIGKGFKILLLLGLYCFGLTGCNAADQKANDLFFKKLSVPIGQSVEITIIGEKPTSGQSAIVLNVKNLTNDCVVLPFDFGTQIFAYFQNDWSGISNSIEYTNHDDITLGPTGSSSSETTVFARPNYSPVPANAYPVKLRIVVTGRACKSGVPTADKTAGYIELTINKP